MISVVAMLTAAAVVASPCETATLMRAGDTAACDGTLVPTDDIRDVIRMDGELAACRIERDGQQRACDVRVAALEAEIDELELLLEQPAGTNWTAVLIGVGVGLLAGGAVVYALTRE